MFQPLIFLRIFLKIWGKMNGMIFKFGTKFSKDEELVYSSDKVLNKSCLKCKKLLSVCVCVPEQEMKGFKFVAILRMEKQGRGGKTVTVIDKLPKNEIFLKEWTTTLKKKCGSGGTYLMDGVDGVIEIQGDQREVIRAALTKAGIKNKG